MYNKTLILVRHAKSDWSGNELDHDRPLQIKGKKRAIEQAKKLAQILPQTPDYWASSSAKRAADTAHIFGKEFTPNPVINYSRSWYTFSPSSLVKEIRALPNENRSCIVFCHNEAVTYAAIELGNVFIENITTAGMVCIQFNQNDWGNIGKGFTEWIHLGKK